MTNINIAIRSVTRLLPAFLTISPFGADLRTASTETAFPKGLDLRFRRLFWQRWICLFIFILSMIVSASGQRSIPRPDATLAATDATWKMDGTSRGFLVDTSCIPAPWASEQNLVPAKWIWSQSCVASDDESHTFSTAFTVTGNGSTVELDIAVDNYADVSINGQSVQRVEGFGATITLDILKYVHNGSNQIAIEVHNTSIGVGSGWNNPAGLLARLRETKIAPVTPGTGSCANLNPKVTAEAINQDDPNNTEFATLNGALPVLYGGSKSATSDKLKLTASVQTSRGLSVSQYKWSVSGAGAQLYRVPPPLAGFNVWNVGSIKPAPVHITFLSVMTLSNGMTCTATKDFEVGIRTDDTLVIGWIDKDRVPLPIIDVTGPTLGKFPPNGIVTDKTVTLFDMATHSGFFKPIRGKFMEEADGTYILNWLFKFAPNPEPPPSFKDEKDLDAFLENGHYYKLFNRFQIKYRTEGAKFTAPPIILKQRTAIGITLDPITEVVNFPGEGGPTEGHILPPTAAITQISQINEGSPYQNAVKAFNLVAAPYGQMLNAPKWNDIGSMITFGIGLGTQSKIDMQLYPTYYLYTSTDSGGVLTRDKSFVFPQAANPIDNFTPHHFYGRGYDVNTNKQASLDLKLLFRRSNR